MNEWVTVNEYARLNGMTREQVYFHIGNGDIPAKELLSVTLVPRGHTIQSRDKNQEKKA